MWHEAAYTYMTFTSNTTKLELIWTSNNDSFYGIYPRASSSISTPKSHTTVNLFNTFEYFVCAYVNELRWRVSSIAWLVRIGSQAQEQFRTRHSHVFVSSKIHTYRPIFTGRLLSIEAFTLTHIDAIYRRACKYTRQNNALYICFTTSFRNIFQTLECILHSFRINLDAYKEDPK